ncbi:sulfatase-like hydrolase/transferase [Oligoflexus tunisiensis]|uniref:sulfatase-like hydrolase/transferase n=1 Tax=Oligoflexus tunisiensis TaxID=708132 RepID=UPI00159EFE0D|nr:sulfatase-like hydrolase/transferase [Oligoflexus tunisiensis]
MTHRFISRFFSLLLIIPAHKVHAYWQVQDRPLDPKPYGRTVENPISVSYSHQGVIEGSGKPISSEKPFEMSGFVRNKTEKRLEFQIGYVTDTATYQPENCPVSIHLAMGTMRSTLKQQIPLRSVHPNAETFENLSSRYDYLMPAFSISLPQQEGSYQLSVVSDQRCVSGKLFVFDPKVWEKANSIPARRMALIVADSIGSAWFQNKRRFMPFVQNFFSKPGRSLATNVISISTNTIDTTRGLTDMRQSLQEATKLMSDHFDEKTGLIPSFLNAGYEVVNYSSNYLLSQDINHGGFRQYYNLDITGGANNSRNAEIRVSMYLDWLHRHPDHNVFIFTWFDDSHAWVTSPANRPEFKLQNLPYKVLERNQKTMEEQARSLSYLDMQLEKLLKSPQLQNADILFTSDHGLDYKTLNHPHPMWPSCSHSVSMNNNHVHPDAVETFAGLKLAHGTSVVPAHETSLFDWIKTAILRSHPNVDTSRWQGEDLKNSSPEDVIVSVSHQQRGSFRHRGQHYYFSELTCENKVPLTVLDKDLQPVSLEKSDNLIQRLVQLGFGQYQELSLDYYQMASDCRIKVDGLKAADNSTETLNFGMSPANWMESQTSYISALSAQVTISAIPDGCADVRISYLSRNVNGKLDLNNKSFLKFLASPAPHSLKFSRPTLVIAADSGALSIIKSGKFVHLNSQQKEKTSISANLKQAMKSWGYIQNEKE